MSRAARSRSAVCAAALTLVAMGCATPDADDGPRDVRVVDLSDEAAEKIAERVAAYIPKEPVPPGRHRPVVEVPPQPRVPRGAIAPAVEVPPPAPRAEIFPHVPSVPAERTREAAQRAVDAALRWLGEHQADDGSWSAAAFTEECEGEPCRGAGEAVYTPGVTGLALLAFLGDGHVPTGDGPHAQTVRKGLMYLRSIQDSEGCFGPRVSQHFQYNHALASLAMTEAYGLSKSPLWRESAQSAVGFVQYSRNPYMGWRYGVRDGDNDTSMTSWMVMVLASARNAGLQVDDNAFRGALAWVDKMTEPELGRVGYNRRGGPPARTQEMIDRFPSEHSEAMTAAGLLIRLHAGQSAPSSDVMQKGADLLAAKPPVWALEHGTNDFYYWHLGSMALARIGGARWDTWRSALHTAVTGHQIRGDGHDAGSWEPADPWSDEGGRVYATATLCLALQQVEHAVR